VKWLLAFDRGLARVEGFFLVASLGALLLLTLYSVLYRNLVAPVVLRLQAAQAPVVEQALPEPVPAPAPEAPGPKAPQGGYGGDLDEAEQPAQPAPAPSANYAGDLDEAAPAPASGEQAAPASAPPNYAGDLDDEQAPAPSPRAGYAGDLEDEPAKEAPASPGSVAGGGQGRPGAAVATPAVGATVMPEDTPLLKFLKRLAFPWIDAVTRHLLLWIGFFGAALAVARRGHIAIDAFSRLFPERARKRLRIVLDLVSLVACIFLARAALRFMLAEREGGGKLYGDVPSWVGITIVPVGFALLAWHFFFEALLGTLSALGVAHDLIEARNASLATRPEEAAAGSGPKEVTP